ncbi:MAG: flavodoxin-dependent (E)-4-hydroxy-3-methylbut-2-enyl-diphosphate synthase [Acidobacteria bacterium]|nr:flavodoxin-dependent (E)-4-hydroxy-3-methylbut-2-enyl-diphosphate synthase [Acidobacteriota bacterium]
MGKIERRRTPSVRVGAIQVGSDHPVVVQSMTNTDTADVEATVEQIRLLAEAGSELVRVTVNNEKAAAAVEEIVARLHDSGCEVPVIGDFHYNGHILLRGFPGCAHALAKYRINPGNVGVGRSHDDNFRQMIDVAIQHGKPVRIGVNGGSLDQALLAQMMDENARRADPLDAGEVLTNAIVASAIDSGGMAEEYGLPHERIILSAKVSDVQQLVRVYQKMSRECDYPLHLGLTEAGMGMKGTVSSTAALAILLERGIGDTIRVSLTPAPGGDRREEVRICLALLQSLGMRSFSPQVTACPGCGRTTSSFFQAMAEQIQDYIEQNMRRWRQEHPGVEMLKVAVMGCVVNGPGESKHSDIGISLPGSGEDPKAPVYVDGQLFRILKGPGIVRDFLTIMDEYVARRYGTGVTSS